MMFSDTGILTKDDSVSESPSDGQNRKSSGNIPNWLDLPDPKGFKPKKRYRTVWISDVHLGTSGCNA